MATLIEQEQHELNSKLPWWLAIQRESDDYFYLYDHRELRYLEQYGKFTMPFIAFSYALKYLKEEKHNMKFDIERAEKEFLKRKKVVSLNKARKRVKLGKEKRLKIVATRIKVAKQKNK